MVRSYGVGCTVFVFTRVLQLIPAVAPKGPDDLGINIMFFMLLALAVPSFYFGWHELTTGKPKAARQ
jgi:hypothetical protein